MNLKSIAVLSFAAVISLIMGFGRPAEHGSVNTLASRSFSLEKRYANPQVNEVMKDNILLTLVYLQGKTIDPQRIDWDAVREPFSFELTLDEGRTFAFQKDVLEKYKGTIAYTPNAHFGYDEGFKSDGYLVGDGVCHLASLIYWAARDAGLSAEAPVNHDFARIQEVPRKYGVSIYSNPADPATGATQNLYVTNNQKEPITMKFTYDGENLAVSFSTQKLSFLAQGKPKAR